MRVFLKIVALIFGTVLADQSTAMLCWMGQEPDPQSSKVYRWVIPVPDPCLCTEVRLGSLNTQTPGRPFRVKYYGTFLHSNDPVEIKRWLKCAGFCGDKLGMESGDIPDASIKASSVYTEHENSPDNCRPKNGRLNYPGSTNTVGGWCPAASDTYPWFQVDLAKAVSVEGVTIQGSFDSLGEWHEHVTAYQVQFGLDESSWFNVLDGTDKARAQTFPGNTDQTTPVTSLFARPIQARFVRIKPTGYNEWPSMRIELVGCK